MEQLNHYESLKKVNIKNTNFQILLILCDISPENAGIILRSAEAFSVSQILYYGKNLDKIQKIKKISRGSKVKLDHTDLLSILSLKQSGYSLFALEITDTAKSIEEIKLTDKVCFIVGNEKTGVPSELLSICDKSYFIPMAGTISSLNVAVASSILMYSIFIKA